MEIEQKVTQSVPVPTLSPGDLNKTMAMVRDMSVASLIEKPVPMMYTLDFANQTRVADKANCLRMVVSTKLL